MRLKLISPARKVGQGEGFWDMKTLSKLSNKKAGTAPLALPTLAALVPSFVEVDITDENVEPINFDEGIDLVGISFMTSLAPRAYEIADEYRKRGVKVVLGGIHASMLPDEAIQHADSVVIGEAEDIWSGLLNDFKDGKLKKFYRCSQKPDLKSLPIPRWDLLKSEQYCYHTMQIGRGCPFDCEFCSVRIFNGQKYRFKTIDQVLREVETLKKIDDKKLIFFVDDNILAIPTYTKDLLRVLVLQNIKWWCQASINRLDDKELLRLMYDSGCRLVFIGFESISLPSLKMMNKDHINNIERYTNIVKKIHDNGIAVFGSFILGNDCEDERIFDATINFIEKTNIPFSMVNILTPCPGTRLFHRLSDEGRILHKNWEKYDVEYPCFKPRLMSLDDLQSGRSKVVRQIYSYDSLYARLRKVWSQGALLRRRDRKTRIFTKGRIFFTLKSLWNKDLKRMIFTLKSLWNFNRTSIAFVLLSLNFHDYAYGLKKFNLKGKKSIK